uniref:Uncharacterized protein n=1 Tax=Caenorhabditis japonica TaxID=281687 RepID=A0A8R1IBK2_CAEJA
MSARKRVRTVCENYWRGRQDNLEKENVRLRVEIGEALNQSTNFLILSLMIRKQIFETQDDIRKLKAETAKWEKNEAEIAKLRNIHDFMVKNRLRDEKRMQRLESDLAQSTSFVKRLKSESLNNSFKFLQPFKEIRDRKSVNLRCERVVVFIKSLIAVSPELPALRLGTHGISKYRTNTASENTFWNYVQKRPLVTIRDILPILSRRLSKLARHKKLIKDDALGEDICVALGGDKGGDETKILLLIENVDNCNSPYALLLLAYYCGNDDYKSLQENCSSVFQLFNNLDYVEYDNEDGVRVRKMIRKKVVELDNCVIPPLHCLQGVTQSYGINFFLAEANRIDFGDDLPETIPQQHRMLKDLQDEEEIYVIRISHLKLALEQLEKAMKKFKTKKKWQYRSGQKCESRICIFSRKEKDNYQYQCDRCENSFYFICNGIVTEEEKAKAEQPNNNLDCFECDLHDPQSEEERVKTCEKKAAKD